MYIELRTDYQGLILPIPMVVYIMDTFISTDFCLKNCIISRSLVINPLTGSERLLVHQVWSLSCRYWVCILRASLLTIIWSRTVLWNLVLPSIKALTWFVFFILGSIYSDTSGSIPLHPRRCDVINTCIYTRHTCCRVHPSPYAKNPKYNTSD